MKRVLLRSALQAVCYSAAFSLISVVQLPCVSAQSASSKQAAHHWKSQKLSKFFYSEGGNAADLDGDGHLDIIAGPKLYFGPGFEKEVPLTDANPFSIIGYSKFFFGYDYDVDRDGLTDVIIIGFPGEAAHWYKNPGKEKARDGMWVQHVILDTVDNESPTFTDVTGDGKPELVCCHGGNFGFAEIPSNPIEKWTFRPVSEGGKHQRFTHGLGVGDVNDDGRLDIMSKDGWWEQPAAPKPGAWPFHAFAFSGPGGAQMYAVDLDRDGKNEVVTSLAAHGYGLAVYKKRDPKSAETWDKIDVMTDKVETSPTGLAISQLHAVDIADMDNDGQPDIVTGKRFWAHNGSDRGENEPPMLVWFKPISGPGGLRFQPNIIDADSGVGTQIVAKDVNKDGLLDVVSVSKRGIHVLTQVAGQEPTEKPVPVADQAIPVSDTLGGFRPGWGVDHVMNVDFEKGDLRDWTATGAAFFNQPIQGDSVAKRRNDMKSDHQGEYWIGSYEVTGDIAFGTLTSKPFRLTHPWISFLQGGGGMQETRFELIEAETQKVLVQAVGVNAEAMKRAILSVKSSVGKTVQIRLIDNSKDGWGHINFDDFRMHAEEPKIANAQRLPVLDKLAHKSLPPDQVAAAMTLPEGFSVQVIASEPEVRQPIAMTIDAKGRVWIAEAYQYPNRAKGDEGKDRVLILEDTNGDGILDKSKVFADKLNLVSGIEVGFGGLWVGAAPYLLFIPDANGDDLPDGPAVKKLDGWGYQDTHETLNSFIWGPDGWLYGCHGVFTHSDVRVVKKTPEETQAGPGTKINAGIWRYHPQTERFEVFAHGTSNPWGVDFNDRGDAFLTACVIPHLYHIIPQARYQRQAGQHFNPYTYADIQTIALHRHWIGDTPHSGNNRSDGAGGGHAHSGAMFYLGGSWPEQYRDQLFMNNIHGARLNQDKISRRGSGYVGDRAPDFLFANDQSSQILYFRSGPDGQVIAIDWYDAQQCHVNDPAKHDQSNGRVYRIAYNNAKPVQVDLESAKDSELVAHLLNPNDWFVRTARRILMERAHQKKLSDGTIASLRQHLSHAEARIRLRALWALAACRSVEHRDIELSLRDQDEHVRGWAVRMLTQPESMLESQRLLKAEHWTALTAMAKSDPSPVVRLELAAGCQEWPVESSAAIVGELVKHGEDKDDHNLPLMVWYAVSRQIESSPVVGAKIAASSSLFLVQEFAMRQVAQTYVAGSNADVESALVQLLTHVVNQKESTFASRLLDSVLVGLESKRTVSAPKGWSELSAKFLLHADPTVRQRGAQLASKLNDTAALEMLRSVVRDSKSSDSDRTAALNVLKQVKADGVSQLAFGLLDKPSLRSAALSAIADTLDAEGANQVLQSATKWPELAERRAAWYAMLRRTSTAEVLLTALEKKTIPAGELSADMVQQIQRLESDSLNQMIERVWGDVRSLDADKQKAVATIRALVEKTPEQVDLSRGKAVFAKVCGQCHVLFGEGGKIGPELTGSNRRDLNYLLENIMDPSAVMAKEYQPWIVQTVDDQVVTGLLKQSTANSMKLQTATDEVVIYNSDIAQKKQSKTSMMPSDLLTPLSEAEIQALIAYLRSERK
jgi:putative membrane-bound dehydrogenase-like protein